MFCVFIFYLSIMYHRHMFCRVLGDLPKKRDYKNCPCTIYITCLNSHPLNLELLELRDQSLCRYFQIFHCKCILVVRFHLICIIHIAWYDSCFLFLMYLQKNSLPRHKIRLVNAEMLVWYIIVFNNFIEVFQNRCNFVQSVSTVLSTKWRNHRINWNLLRLMKDRQNGKL